MEVRRRLTEIRANASNARGRVNQQRLLGAAGVCCDIEEPFDVVGSTQIVICAAWDHHALRLAFAQVADDCRT